MERTYLLAMRCPVHRRRDSNLGFRVELENLGGDVQGKGNGSLRRRLLQQGKHSREPVLTITVLYELRHPYEVQQP